MCGSICKYFGTLLLLATLYPLYSQEGKGGSLIYEEFRLLSLKEREELIIDAFKLGEYPSFITNWEEILFREKDAQGRVREVVIKVSPDYLAVGNDSDYFTTPLTPQSSQIIAQLFKASLPTPKLVDLIYCYSKLKVEPFNYIPRGDRNETPDLFYDHSKVIQAQIKASGNTPGIFVAGNKKDIVVSSKLSDPKRTHHVIIYGWHRPNSVPIQPETNIHIDSYVDYSHGARLIYCNVLVDGVEMEYDSILKDPLLFTLLSYDKEPLLLTRYR